MRNLRIISLIILVLFFLSGCMSKTQKETIYNKAVPIAQQYMKNNFNADVIFSDNYEFLDPMSSTIVLYGHMSGDKDATFDIMIDHGTFKISQVGGSSEVMDRRVKLDKKNKSSTENTKK
ncbi:hypothetical protein [Paenibacillus azoreducens]|uniref:DUF1433 domain-containing protein n=1 Tax=Paenibacillus azoreducens TaxID=116718 RepID=A0A919YIW3_9BACL|nr:hypothetical protein [Paenibacillus azoreducens]GIO51589.1 hypothetical protein J34TS1_63540 [Paenibacillus azoreducens]